MNLLSLQSHTSQSTVVILHTQQQDPTNPSLMARWQSSQIYVWQALALRPLKTKMSWNSLTGLRGIPYPPYKGIFQHQGHWRDIPKAGNSVYPGHCSPRWQSLLREPPWSVCTPCANQKSWISFLLGSERAEHDPRTTENTSAPPTGFHRLLNYIGSYS